MKRNTLASKSERYVKKIDRTEFTKIGRAIGNGTAKGETTTVKSS